MRTKTSTTILVHNVQKCIACLIDRFTNRMCTNFSYNSQNVTNYNTQEKSMNGGYSYVQIYNDIFFYTCNINIQVTLCFGMLAR